MTEIRSFVAIDVEIADSTRHVAGIALSEFVAGESDPVDAWESKVDPETEYTRALRLIDEVTGRCPRRPRTFRELHPLLRESLEGRVVVTHGDLPRRSLAAACERYGLAPIACRWIDAQALARLALRRRREEQYRLESLASWLGIELPAGALLPRAITAGTSAQWCAALLGENLADLVGDDRGSDRPAHAAEDLEPQPLPRSDRSGPDLELSPAGNVPMSMH
jgi:hypothetical protein